MAGTEGQESSPRGRNPVVEKRVCRKIVLEGDLQPVPEQVAAALYAAAPEIEAFVARADEIGGRPEVARASVIAGLDERQKRPAGQG